MQTLHPSTYSRDNMQKFKLKKKHGDWFRIGINKIHRMKPTENYIDLFYADNRLTCGPITDSIHPPASRMVSPARPANLWTWICLFIPVVGLQYCHSSDITRTSSALLLLHVMSSTNKLLFHELTFRTWKPDAFPIFGWDIIYHLLILVDYLKGT